MTSQEVRLILEAVCLGQSSIESAVESLHSAQQGYRDLEGAKIDTDRERRRGMPEVVYCASKSLEQIVPIMSTLLDAHGLAYGTRCEPAIAEEVMGRIDGGSYDPVSRTIRFGPPRPVRTTISTAVITAGSSDIPVAEEACATLETFGAPVDRIYDTGVAGLHRLLAQRERIERAGILIVVAGMEGALASVVGGLFRHPLIAVPTSVGYGTAMAGFTALFGMLSSCASGITVVNIDNGFGAATAALTILDAMERYSRGEE